MKSLAFVGLPALPIGVAAALVLVACASPGKSEAAALDRAVTAFRQAENAQKPALARAVEATSCAADDVCAARVACIASARSTAEGLERKQAVERALASQPPAPDDPRAKRLLEELAAAEASLAEGQARVLACDNALRALRRTYNLR